MVIWFIGKKPKPITNNDNLVSRKHRKPNLIFGLVLNYVVFEYGYFGFRRKAFMLPLVHV
ncbi:hypothetical protein Hdeb2414_s0001g00035971 [Helianthus debilis subsp. tardiflorus]